jgi:hypothetical protein
MPTARIEVRFIEPCDRACASGHVECLERALGSDPRFDAITLTVAARFGHADALRLLLKRDRHAWKTVLKRTGVFHQYVDRQPHRGAARWLSRAVGLGGSVECLDVIASAGVPLDADLIAEAAARGDIAMIQRALERGRIAKDTMACHAAARHGRIDALRWLHDNGFPWSRTGVCTAAVDGGSLECLAYACENRASMAECRWRIAVSRGHIDIVRFAVERGAWRPSAKTLKIALCCGRIDLARYMRSRGCPLPSPDRICVSLVLAGRPDALRFVRQECRDGAAVESTAAETRSG